MEEKQGSLSREGAMSYSGSGPAGRVGTHCWQSRQGGGELQYWMDARTLGPIRNPNLRFMGATWELSEWPEIVVKCMCMFLGTWCTTTTKFPVAQAICDLHCLST